MKLGVNLPITDIGGDPEIIRDISQQAEELGYSHLSAADHVLGVNAANIPDWGNRNTSDDCFHDPFVLFGFLAACTKDIEFSTQVLVLPQRQAALVAKQAACLDILSKGRFRLGVGVGWNEAEFLALNENFNNRGKRSAEQVELLRQFWKQSHVTYAGEWHHVEDVGINPLPLDREIPIWFGGHQDVTLRRIAKYGNGWIMLEWPPGRPALEQFQKLYDYVQAEGRAPEEVGIEVWVSATDTPDKWREEITFWKNAGVTHVCLNNTFSRYHHQRIPDKTVKAHVDAMVTYIGAVRDLI